MKSNIDKLVNRWSEEYKKERESANPFIEALGSESDRTVGIVSAILLDNWLERLIKYSYIKDSKVNTIFKDEHILRSFYAKINIAYFSGLIPKVFYHDLKLICDIRNKFAHNVTADLKFDDEIIKQRINQFSQISEELVKIYSPKLRFILTVSAITGHLEALSLILSKIRLPTLVKMLKLEEMRFEDMILTPERMKNIIKRTKTIPSC